MDRTKLALVVCVVALAGVVGWQQFSKQAVAPPAPLQIAPPSAPQAGAAAPMTAAERAPAVVPPPAPGPAPKKPSAPRRDVRPAPPDATSASRAEVVTPAPVAVASAPEPASAPASDAPEKYEAMALARLQQGDYREAGELFETALRNGGKATFTIVHDHSKGNFEKDPKASCIGELILSPDEISFAGAGAGDSHHFAASWAEVVDAGSNRFFGSGMGGFHVSINPDGKYKNFNLAPRSKDKQESKLIVELLNANARKTEK